jgi:hypothetical protein
MSKCEKCHDVEFIDIPYREYSKIGFNSLRVKTHRKCQIKIGYSCQIKGYKELLKERITIDQKIIDLEQIIEKRNSKLIR